MYIVWKSRWCVCVCVCVGMCASVTNRIRCSPSPEADPRVALPVRVAQILGVNDPVIWGACRVALNL